MDLEKILLELYPEKNQEDCLSGIVTKMGEILKNSSNYLKIKKVIPAGSFGKKTLLKNHLEIDCVYILEYNGYSYYHNLQEVQRVLKDVLPKNTIFDTSDHSISFHLNRPIGLVFVDLLPAFEINKPSQMLEVKNKDAYYGSTALLQKKYFRNVIRNYSRFTDLVRLVKSWRNINNIPLSSYMIELIISNAVFDTRKDQEFHFFLEMCFRTIQSFTDGRAIVPVYWEKEFNNSEIIFNYSPNNLWIIDPSDPSENISEDISEEEKYIINSGAITGVNNIKNGKYEFLYK
jgi:hypothetical protein